MVVWLACSLRIPYLPFGINQYILSDVETPEQGEKPDKTAEEESTLDRGEEGGGEGQDSVEDGGST